MKRNIQWNMQINLAANHSKIYRAALNQACGKLIKFFFCKITLRIDNHIAETSHDAFTTILFQLR